MHSHDDGADARGLAAPDAALLNPEVEKPRAAATGEASEAVAQDVSDHSPISDEKRFATLRARLALAGYALSRSDAGDGPRGYFVTRWGMVRDLYSIADAEAFAERVGVRHA